MAKMVICGSRCPLLFHILPEPCIGPTTRVEESQFHMEPEETCNRGDVVWLHIQYMEGPDSYSLPGSCIKAAPAKT